MVVLIALVFVIIALVIASIAIYNCSFTKAPVSVMQQSEPVKFDEKFFFENKEKSGNLFKTYSEALGLGVYIPSDKPILCSKDELKRLICKLNENGSDNFVVIQDNSGRILEISNNGIDEKTEVDVSELENNDWYRGTFEFLRDASYCIDLFFDGVDIKEKFSFKFDER